MGTSNAIYQYLLTLVRLRLGVMCLCFSAVTDRTSDIFRIGCKESFVLKWLTKQIHVVMKWEAGNVSVSELPQYKFK